MVRSQSTPSRQKLLGAWATPFELVDRVVSGTITADWLARRPDPGAPVRVLDPACGDGRFLRAAARRLAQLDVTRLADENDDTDRGTGRTRVVLTGADVDPAALDAMRREPDLSDVERVTGDALGHEWDDRRFDLVLGNPPFLSQMAATTTRGGASRHGGGPYADVAAEFLALAIGLADPDGGRVGLVLPQSILASRDAGAIRAEVDRRAEMCWSWWSAERLFEADVFVCALGFERTPEGPTRASAGEPDRARDPLTTVRPPSWSHVVVQHLGMPELPDLRSAGTVGDRADANANFRDEYYGLVPAVSDLGDGPPLITTGLIDPGRCRWGEQAVRFAKQRFAAPRVARERLDERMQRWADRKLVPKVLVATQTSVIEAVVDAEGAWLPGVPVTSVTPHEGTDPWEIGAVLTSPVATAHVWQALAGTGLSARTVRLGPSGVLAVPWPEDPLDAAVLALRRGDVVQCGIEVTRAFGVDADHPIVPWWTERVSRVTRAPTPRGRATPDDPDPANR